MKKSIFTRNNKKLSLDKCEEWRKVVFSISWKLWLLTLLAALFLFIFFQPNEECSREYYFYLFVIKPTVAQGITGTVCGGILKLLVKRQDQRLMSLCTVVDVSLFAGIAACIHTSVLLSYFARYSRSISTLRHTLSSSPSSRPMHTVPSLSFSTATT